MKLLSLLLVAVAFSSVSCERHEFEETKKLQEHASHHEAETTGEHAAEPAADKGGAHEAENPADQPEH